MADDRKVLGFKIAIDDISNENVELQKLNVQLANLNKEYKDLQKTIKDQGGFASNDQLRQLAAYSKEIDNHKDSINNLKKVVDSAPDSLNRMRASLIDLKDQYANGSASLRAQLTPEIQKLTSEVGKAEQAIGVHSRGVGNYTNSIKNAVAQIFSIAAPAAAAAYALNGLKTAFAGTEAGANLLGRAKVQMTAFFDAIVEGEWRYAFGNELPKDIKVVADLMNKVRIDERAELVAVSAKQLEIQNLRLDAIKAGKDSVKQVELLTQAEKAQGELIELKLEHKKEELNIFNLILAKDPVNTAALNKQAQLEADINNIQGERSLLIASKLETAQKNTLANIEKEKKAEGELSKDEERVLKAKVALEKGLDKNNQSSILQPFNWTVSDEVASVKYKDKVKHNTEDIGNIIDKANVGLTERLRRQNQIELTMEKEKQTVKMQIIKSSTELLNNTLELLFGKSKLVQATELVAEKALAIAQIIIHTQEANAAMTAWGATYAIPTAGVSIAFAQAMNIKNRIEEGISIAAVIAATAAGLVGIGAGKAKGGRITSGIPVYTGTKDDTLIVANKSETVLTDRHVAMLGGSGVMHRIGVPGYAMGGYVGSQAPQIAPAGLNVAELERIFSDRIDRLEVRLDTNKVRASLFEVEVINRTKRI